MIKHGLRGDTEESIRRKLTEPDGPPLRLMPWVIGAVVLAAAVLWLWLR